MTQAEFAALLARLSDTAEAGDGKAFAACFTPDAVYHDYIYGDHKGRAEIAHMLEDLFHRDATDYRWRFFDPVCNGDLGYAWSLSSFTSKVPEFQGKKVLIDGMSRFRLEGGLIADYAESVNGGIAMVQLGVAPARMEKVLRKWAGWLHERSSSRDFLAKKTGP